MKNYDVVIVGGGISGVMAGVQAALENAKTLIIERFSSLGGMLTNGGVNPMMTFHAGEKQVVQGLPEELIKRLVKRGKSVGHVFDTTTYTYTVTPFDPEGMKQELEMMALEAGCDILYNTMLLKTFVSEKKLTKIQVLNKSGITDIYSKVFIDATGDADLSYQAGVKTQLGRVSDNKMQPLTMNMRMANVDIDQLRNYIKTHLERFPKYNNDPSIIDKACKLSFSGFEKEINQAIVDKRLSFLRECVLLFETNNKNEINVNISRVKDIDATKEEEITKAIIEGRKQVREIEAFLKQDIPGFKDSYLLSSGPTIGVRSSRQIIGVHVLNENELLKQDRFYDVICHGGYPIDVHPPEGHDKFVDWSKVKRHLNYGEYYSVPYRSIINNDVENIITVGRCISATFEAQGAIRVSPISAAIGEAGGAAASLMVKYNLERTTDVNYKELQKVLIKYKAYLEVEENDI